MPTIERGLPLALHIIGELRGRAPKSGEGAPVGASQKALDALESQLMVELPPTLRAYLAFDFTFSAFKANGKQWHGLGRFGSNPAKPKPRFTSVRKLAEAKTDLGWTDSRIRTKVIRLPNRPRRAWNALYLGEARRDGELVILGIDHEETNVRVFPRYTAFDLYLAEQSGLLNLSDAQRLEDFESHIALNPELGSQDDYEDGETEY